MSVFVLVSGVPVCVFMHKSYTHPGTDACLTTGTQNCLFLHLCVHVGGRWL